MHLVIFDLDGTLAQTFYSDDNSYITALSEFLPVQPGIRYWEDCRHLTDSAVLDHIYRKVAGRAPSKPEVETMKSRFLNILEAKRQTEPHFFHEVPGATALVEQMGLHSRFSTGVATGGWECIARFKLEAIGISTNNLEVIGSDLHHSKAAFTKALISRFDQQHSFSKITYVGDSLYDYRTALELGLNFVGVDFKNTGLLQSHGVEKTVPHFEDLDGFFELVEA